MELFAEQGFVVVEGLLEPGDLVPVVGEYGALADDLARRWFPQGVDGYEPSESVSVRLLQLMRLTETRCFQHLDISLPLEEDIEADTPLHVGPAVFGLLRNERLLDAVEVFIGPEIYSNPVQHIRVKPPVAELGDELRDHTLISTTFWHQDQGVIIPEADGSDVLSVWIPMVDVSEDNGCMLVVPGSHTRGLVNHCRTEDFKGIPDALVGERRLPLPMKVGDVLFLNKLTRHASMPNTSRGLRWSFDVRYNPTGQPTGRPWFPGFVARSRSRPRSELKDPALWARSWYAARAALAQDELPAFNRWDPSDPLCA